MILLRLNLLIAITLCAATHVAADELQVAVAAIVDEVGSAAVEKEGVVGLSIGVANPDGVICVRGFGLANVEHQIEATPETVFRIGSITKQFTAAAILRLVEQGKLELDDRLRTFFPDDDFPAGDVTLRQLLQHTSGIPDFTRLPTYRRDRQLDLNPEEVLEKFLNLPLEFSPGSQYRYCNSGYFLAALIVEQASGQTYHEYLEEQLFAPAKLKQTYCDRVARIVPHRAAGYSFWGGQLRNAPHVDLNHALGAGNLSATAGDLLLWQQALIDHKVLNSESFKLMQTPGELTNGKSSQYGFGLIVQKSNSQDVVRHAGGISGFRSELAWYPESGYIIAVLGNSDGVKAPQLAAQIFRRLVLLDETKK